MTKFKAPASYMEFRASMGLVLPKRDGDRVWSKAGGQKEVLGSGSLRGWDVSLLFCLF